MPDPVQQPTATPAGAWSSAGIDAALDRVISDRAVVPPVIPQAQPASATPDLPHGAETSPAPITPPVTDPAGLPTQPLQPPAEPEPVIEPPIVEDSTLHREAYEAVQKIGGAEELELLQSIAAPLVAPEIDGQRFYETVEQQRGAAAADTLLWSAYEIAGPAFVTEALAHPETLGDSPIARDIAAFNAWKAQGSPAASAPIPATSQPVTRVAPAPVSGAAIALPEIDPDDYTLSPELRNFIDAAKAMAPVVTQLQNQVNELNGYRESETQRLAREAREAQDRAHADALQFADRQENKLYETMGSVVDKALTQCRWSTNPDAGKAADEDKETRADIDARVTAEFLRDINHHPVISKQFDAAKAAYLKGDVVGPRQVVQQLKAHIQTLTQRHIERHGGKLVAGVQADAAVAQNNGAPGRTVVAGPGSGGSPATQLPPPASGKSWDNLDAQVDRVMNQRGMR